MAHLAKLIEFYQIAGQYVIGYLGQMELTDKEMGQLISFFGSSKEVT